MRTFAALVAIPAAFAIILALVVPLLFMPVALTIDFLWFPLLMIGTGCLYGYFRIKSAAASEASVQIVIEADRIMRFQEDKQSIVIFRSEVARIVELPGEGMWIHAADRVRQIFVPARLTGYAELRGSLDSWSTVTTRPNYNYTGYLVLALAVLFFILTIIRTTRPYALGFGFVLIAFLGVVGLIQHLRKISSRTSRQI